MTAKAGHLSKTWQPSRYSKWLLAALNLSGKHIYGGTVPEKEVRRRRAAGKVARKSRRINRGR